MPNKQLPLSTACAMQISRLPSEEIPFSLYLSAAELYECLLHKFHHQGEAHPSDTFLPLFASLDLLNAQEIRALCKTASIYHIQGTGSVEHLQSDDGTQCALTAIDRGSLSYTTFTLSPSNQGRILKMMAWLEDNCVCPHCRAKALPHINWDEPVPPHCQINWNKEKDTALFDILNSPAHTIH